MRAHLLSSWSQSVPLKINSRPLTVLFTTFLLFLNLIYFRYDRLNSYHKQAGDFCRRRDSSRKSHERMIVLVPTGKTASRGGWHNLLSVIFIYYLLFYVHIYSLFPFVHVTFKQISKNGLPLNFTFHGIIYSQFSIHCIFTITNKISIAYLKHWNVVVHFLHDLLKVYMLKH